MTNPYILDELVAPYVVQFERFGILMGDQLIPSNTYFKLMKQFSAQLMFELDFCFKLENRNTKGRYKADNKILRKELKQLLSLACKYSAKALPADSLPPEQPPQPQAEQPPASPSSAVATTNTETLPKEGA